MKSQRSWPFALERLFVLVVLAILSATAVPAQTIGTGFTYQGRLFEAGAPVDGTRNLTFRLFDASSGGSQVGPDFVLTGVAVADGLVSVSLDFGADIFNDNARWLEIQVESFVLTPRRELRPAPSALYAVEAGGVAGGVDDADANPANELNAGASFAANILSVADAGGSVTADLSAIAPSWNNLTNVPAGFADGTDNVDDADASATNEIQTISASGSQVSLSSGGGSARVSSLAASDGSPTDALFVDANGNAGMGTTSPNAKLEVAGRAVIRDAGNNGALILSPSTAGFGVDPELVIQSSEVSGGDTAAFHLSRNAIFQTSDDSYRYIDDAGDTASKIEFESDGDIKFSYAAAGTGAATFSDVMLIDGDAARVGIGTTSPGAKLHLGGTAGTDGLMFPDGTLQTTAFTGSITGDNLGNHAATATLNLNGNVLSDLSANAKLLLQDAQGITLDVTGTATLTNATGLRIESATDPLAGAISPNIIGGALDNSVTSGAAGAVICGGGASFLNLFMIIPLEQRGLEELKFLLV
jgi:hypothetical protein